MCAAPEISPQIHPRPLPVPTPPPQASPPTILTLLASSNICWQPGPRPGPRPLSLFPLHGHLSRVRGFLCSLGFGLPLRAFAHIPNSTKHSPETYLLCGQVLLCGSLGAL